MLTQQENDLAASLADGVPREFIRALARHAGLAVLIIGRPEVEEHLGQLLTEDQWDWLHELDSWEDDAPSMPNPGEFIDGALGAANAHCPMPARS